MPELAARTPKRLERADAEWADLVVTMGCGDACPNVRARVRQDWAIPDPKDLAPAEFGRVRDLVEKRVRELLDDLVGPPER